MTKVQIYQEAVATACADLDNVNPMAFEVQVPERALALGLSQPEFALFNQMARQARSTLNQLKQQDAQIAAQIAAAAAKASAKPPVVPVPGQNASPANV